MQLIADSNRFVLRPWQIHDVENLVRHADNIHVAQNLTDMFPHPYTTENARAFIEKVAYAVPANVFAIVSEGEAIGGIGIHPQHDIMRKNAELGYWLGQNHWGKGIISEAIPMIVKYAFENFDINRIFARPFGSNLASQRVLEKSGFVLEGKFAKTIYKSGRYEDELVYAIRKNEIPSS